MKPFAARSWSAALLAFIATGVLAQQPYEDPVPHEVLAQPYRVCQDLEELTARINNLYRKPHHKLFDATGSYAAVWWIAVGLGVLAMLLHLPINERPMARLHAAARP